MLNGYSQWFQTGRTLGVKQEKDKFGTFTPFFSLQTDMKRQEEAKVSSGDGSVLTFWCWTRQRWTEGGAHGWGGPRGGMWLVGAGEGERAAHSSSLSKECARQARTCQDGDGNTGIWHGRVFTHAPVITRRQNTDD